VLLLVIVFELLLLLLLFVVNVLHVQKKGVMKCDEIVLWFLYKKQMRK